MPRNKFNKRGKRFTCQKCKSLLKQTEDTGETITIKILMVSPEEYKAQGLTVPALQEYSHKFKSPVLHTWAQFMKLCSLRVSALHVIWGHTRSRCVWAHKKGAIPPWALHVSHQASTWVIIKQPPASTIITCESQLQGLALGSRCESTTTQRGQSWVSIMANFTSTTTPSPHLS